MQANCVNPHLVINVAHTHTHTVAVSRHAIMVIGMKGSRCGVRQVNNEAAGMKCNARPIIPTSATEEKIKSCASGSGIVRTRPPRDEAIIKVGIVCH